MQCIYIYIQNIVGRPINQQDGIHMDIFHNSHSLIVVSQELLLGGGFEVQIYKPQLHMHIYIYKYLDIQH